MDEFIVIKSTGRPLLGRSTAEKLKVLRVGPSLLSDPRVCSVVTEGSEVFLRSMQIYSAELES